MLPSISVIMPVYNTEKFVSMAVESILNQSFSDFEFIIIDDGSSDASLSIVEKYAASDKRIKLIQNETNLGIVCTLNAGLEIACGKYIARMDADDISPVNRLERQFTYLEQNPDIGVLGTNVTYINEHNQPLHKGKLKHQNKESIPFIHWSLMWRCNIYHPTVMIRKSILDETGYKYEEDYEYAEDYDLWTRLMHHTLVDRLYDVVVQMRVLSTSISRKNNKKQSDLIIKIRKREISDYIKAYDSESGLDTLCNVFSNYLTENASFRNASTILTQMYQTFMLTDPTIDTKEEVLRDLGERRVKLAFAALKSGKLSDSLYLFFGLPDMSLRLIFIRMLIIHILKSLVSFTRIIRTKE